MHQFKLGTRTELFRQHELLLLFVVVRCMDRKDAVPEEFCIHQFGLMPETTQKCDVTCEVQVCKFSEWSEFSACPRHCGGYRVRNRTMEGKVRVQPQFQALGGCRVRNSVYYSSFALYFLQK